MWLAVTGGKGGVGKTTVAVHVHRILGWDALDLDVTTPNLHLYLDCEEVERSDVYIPCPKLEDEDACDLCGTCARVCAPGALVVGRSWDLDPDLCHGCGLCIESCPNGALAYDRVRIGEVRRYRVSETGATLTSGSLDVGDRRSRHLVHALLEGADDERDLILDTPAGAGKDVYDVLKAADAAIAVTQPTPAAYHDLRRLMRVADRAGIEVVILINRSDLSDSWRRRIEEEVRDPVVEAPTVDDPPRSEVFREAVERCLEEVV
ncbi:4Fe-4S binding protein [Methanopyrus kandleri]|uniref:MinD superfamily P-loop ATPase containing an inserted ferredoxin domain n=1 Tax=Methanopyrus kandleri (strain AV19 / DSM 6324 / JCM 9639 / NBRC 100938) TaxID=190192 RepID=Q8TVZ8_METKA|nr:4Fe-4S binding protein [Methanopyrus kandleri]AAM02453.1 MinD superfamily P-loop ATPase containing an inserted ferredoxin domain [Methanopyrus kandleri AV19]